MKTRLCLIFALALPACAGASAQKRDDLARVKLRTATLVSQARHGDAKQSVFNFEHGVRGDEKFPVRPSLGDLNGTRDPNDLSRTPTAGDPLGVRDSRDLSDLSNGGRRPRSPGAAAEPPARTRYDLRFGGLTVNGFNDWLEVGALRGARSVIKDLGEMSWSEVTRVPFVDASPVPYTGVVRLTTRGVVAPQNVAVRAVPGHMYVLRVKDEQADYYVMFRVESIDPKGECRLTWKRVPPPKG